MVIFMDRQELSTNHLSPQLLIGKRIRLARLRKGWNQRELSERSKVSRTTLFQMERGAIPTPRAATLHRLATALELPVSYLNSDQPGEFEQAPLVPPSEKISAAEDFDRQTNPFVEIVRQQFPQVFSGFTSEDWDELFSSFGTGGALTEEGVRQMAEVIAKKRETLRRLSILLETHLGTAATAMIDSLFQLISVQIPETSPLSGE